MTTPTHGAYRFGINLGQTPTTHRRIGVVFGGQVEGERLSGNVLDGGSDWQSVRPDGSTILDVPPQP